MPHLILTLSIDSLQKTLVRYIAGILFTHFFLLMPAAYADSTESSLENIEQIRNKVAHMLKQHLHDTIKQARIEVSVAKLDPRLKLAKCDIPSTMKINGSKKRTRNMTVRISCNGQSPWSIFVPAKIDIYQTVATTTRDIYKGEILSVNDIATQERNTGNFGFGLAKTAAPLIGNTVTRNIAAGSVIRLSHISKPIVIKRGDKLTLESGTQGLAVAATVIALSKGKEGEQIRVKNTQSKRIIDAFVIAPGRVTSRL
ncbi:flagellar basal body P-ring formation chaperone FlgA [Marinagarivorans algicola]|uniref:flagellar basal body P-ring formation chaperone FlgA n=1 Tax=Marinagarivorans algicola TaxID=1513270 RepID=UPI0006B8C632|nr:flagellar basal body P-ring formation chaperone FlgA [Marinagarivorans algicola]